MKLTIVQLQQYLSRIGLNNIELPLNASLETLDLLHRHHVMNIPFENLDVHRGIVSPDINPISLESQKVFNKLVIDKRGGYCFETNLLFKNVLKTIGFKVNSHKGRVMWGNINEQGIPFKRSPSHRMLTVEIEKSIYLADVGFGGPGPVEPLLLKNQEENSQYRIRIDEDLEYLLEYKAREKWIPLYSFDQKVIYNSTDYQVNNDYCAKDPDSIFVKRFMCARPTTTGRVNLFNNKLTIRQKEGNNQEVILKSKEELLTTLKNYFDISLPEDTSFNGKGKEALLFSQPSEKISGIVNQSKNGEGLKRSFQI